MLNPMIKHPYAKLVADIITIISFIALVIILAFNFYLNVSTEGFQAGFKINNSIAFYWVVSLVAISIISDVISSILKRQKRSSI